ncbi:MAG: sigma factor-like helix-turn-helix DNA-binding protein [bacterium]|nr:sigma factor-like helix-turn-helix DNA-binding protein [bacterium]
MNSEFIKKLAKELTSDLSPRQREVIEGRFGLKNSQCLTLAAVGERYGLTRERIRQIERAALNMLQERFNNGSGAKFVDSVSKNLKRYNGVREEGQLLADLRCSQDDLNRMRFVLKASDKFGYHSGDDSYRAFWYLDNASKKKAVDFVSRLKTQLKNNKDAGYSPKGGQDLNYVLVSKAFAFSPFGKFGLSEWPEIMPQNSREWAYLILQREKEPLHFTELATAIDKHRKSNRRTNAQTVHNELIKDNRFVLVGRGTYGLRELGLLPGTAKEVISHFIKKHGPLRSNDVVKFVLQERMFKENTLLINLQNKKHFQRLQDGRYSIREA